MWSSSLPSQGHSRLDTGKDRHLVQPLLPSLSKEIRHLAGRAIAFTSVLLGFSAVTQHTVTWAALSLLQKPGSQAWLTSGGHRAHSCLWAGCSTHRCGSLFLPLVRLGQAAGWHFCTGRGGGGWIWEGVFLGEMGIRNSFDICQRFTRRTSSDATRP